MVLTSCTVPGSSSSPRIAFRSRPFSRARRTSAMRLDNRRSLSAFSRSTDSSSSSALSTSSDPVPLRSSFWSGIPFSAPLRRASSRSSVASVANMQWFPPIGGRSAPAPNRRNTRSPAYGASSRVWRRPANTPNGPPHTRCVISGTNLPATRVSATEQDRRTMPEQTLVCRHGHPGAFDLVPRGRAAELPDALAHLGDGLGGDGLAEARQAAGRIDRHPAPDGGGAVAQELLRLALAAQADVLVPVELEGGREVVDLGQADVLGSDAGLGVGRRGDGRPEARGGHRRSMPA